MGKFNPFLFFSLLLAFSRIDAAELFCSDEDATIDALLPQPETPPAKENSPKQNLANQNTPLLEASPEPEAPAPGSAEEVEALVGQSGVRELVDQRAHILFRAYRNSISGKEDSEITDAYVQLASDLANLIREKKIVDASGPSPEDLAYGYLEGVQKLLTHYERWAASDAPEKADDLAQFRTKNDLSLLKILKPTEEASKQSLRYLLLEEALKNPERFLATVPLMAQALYLADENIWKILNEDEQKIYQARVNKLPKKEDGSFSKDRQGLSEFDDIQKLGRDLAAIETLSASLEDFLSRDAVRRKLANEFFPNQNLAEVDFAQMSSAVAILRERASQDVLLRAVENNPKSRNLYDQSRLYTGATDLQMAIAKARAEKIRDFEDKVDLVSYEQVAVPYAEYQRREDLKRSFPDAYTMRITGTTSTVAPVLKTKADRVRFIIAAEIADPVLAASRNQMDDKFAGLLEYSKDELLYLHYLRSVVTGFELFKPEGRWKKEELEDFARRVKRFESAWSSAWISAPAYKFADWKTFLREAQVLEAVVVSKEQRLPGIPFEYLGLGRDFNRTKLMYDRPEAESLSMYQMYLGLDRKQNTELQLPSPSSRDRALMPGSPYRWASFDAFTNDVQKLYEYWDSRRLAKVKTLRPRLTQAFGDQMKIFEESFERVTKPALEEIKKLNEKIDKIESQTDEERSRLSVLQVQSQENERAALVAERNTLQERVNELVGNKMNLEEFRMQLIDFQFDDWDHYQLEQLEYLTDPKEGEARFAWDKPIFENGTTLFDFVLTFNPRSPFAAMEFSHLRDVITEYAVFQRLYGKSPKKFIEGRPEAEYGVAEYLRKSLPERRDLIQALQQDQKFAARMSPGGFAREDDSGIKFRTPIAAHWLKKRDQEIRRHLKAKGVSDNAVGELIADAAEVALRFKLAEKFDGDINGERKDQLTKLVQAELSGMLDYLGEDFFLALSDQKAPGGMMEQGEYFHTKERFPVGTDREKFLKGTTEAMVEAMMNENFDYDAFVEKWGALVFQAQSLTQMKEVNEERVTSEMKSIAQKMIESLQATKSAKKFKPFVNILTAIRDGERVGYRNYTRLQKVGGEFQGLGSQYAEEVWVTTEKAVKEKIELKTLFSNSLALQDASIGIDQKSPEERLRAIYNRIEEVYLSKDRVLKVQAEDRRTMTTAHVQNVDAYLKMIGFTQSPRERDQKGDEDTTKLFPEEMAGISHAMKGTWGVLGHTYSKTRFISHDAVMRNAFQPWQNEWLRERPELDMKTWFYLPEGDQDDEKLRLEDDEDGYAKRVLRFVGVLSDDPRRLSEAGRKNLKRNIEAEEKAIKTLNLPSWGPQRGALADMGKHFFEGGRAVYDSIEQGHPLKREHLLRILEEANMDPVHYGAILTQPQDVFFRSGGEKLSEEETEKLLKPVGIWGYYGGLKSSDKKKVRAQLGQLSRFVTASHFLFNSTPSPTGEQRIPWTEVLGQIVAPAFMREMLAGKGEAAPISFATDIKLIDKDRKTLRELKTQRDEILKARIAEIPLAFEDSSPQSQRVFLEAADVLKQLSDEDLDRFWKEFQNYVSQIRENNDLLVHEKFIGRKGRNFARYPLDQAQLFQSAMEKELKGVRYWLVDMFDEKADPLKKADVLSNSKIQAMLLWFRTAQTKDGKEWWPSIQSRIFARRIHIDSKTYNSAQDQAEVSRWGEAEIAGWVPNDKDYQKNEAMRELRFRRAFPDFKFAEEQRFTNTRNGMLDEAQTSNMVHERWKSFVGFMEVMNPEVAKKMPSDLGADAIRYYERGLYDPERVFRAMGYVVGQNIAEADVLKLSNDPQAFADVLWSKRESIFNTINRDLISDDLFEGSVYDANGEKLLRVGKIKTNKIDLAKQIIREFYKKTKKPWIDELRSASGPLGDQLKLDSWLKDFEANPFLHLNFYVPSKDLESDADPEKEKKKQEEAELAKMVQAFSGHNGKTILSPAATVLLVRAQTSFRDEVSAEARARQDELQDWIRDRLDEFSTPWFRDQARYDPPYRSRLLTNPNPTIEPGELMPWAQYQLVSHLLANKNNEFTDGNSVYSGAENILRSDALYGTYVEEFLKKLSTSNAFAPEILSRVTGQDAKFVRANAEKISRLLKDLQLEDPASNLSSKEASRLIQRQLQRMLNNTSKYRDEKLEPQGAYLLNSEGKIDRNAALKILVLDEAEEFFNRPGQASNDWNSYLGKEKFRSVLAWVIQDLSATLPNGDLVDPDRVNNNLITRERDEWSNEELQQLATDLGFATSYEAEKFVDEKRVSMIHDFKMIREIVRKSVLIAENENARKKLETARDLVHASQLALTRNLLYSQLFSLQSEAISHSGTVLESTRDLLKMQEALGIPMDRILSGMEQISYEDSVQQAIAMKDVFADLDSRRSGFWYSLGSGTGQQIAALGLGAVDAIAETGYWAIETPQVLSASMSMNEEQFYRFLQHQNAVAAKDVQAGRFNLRARYTGWKPEYLEENGYGGFLAHHVINGASLAFMALKAAKPVLGAAKAGGARAVATSVGAQAVAGAERNEVVTAAKAVAGTLTSGEAKSEGAEIIAKGAVASASETAELAGKGRLGKLWDIATKERHLFGQPQDNLRAPIQTALFGLNKNADDLARNGFTFRRAIDSTAKGTGRFAVSAIANTAPISIGFMLMGWPFATEEELKKDYWDTAFEEMGRGLGIVPALMLKQLILQSLASRGGRYRYFAYLNKNVISDPILSYILRTTGKSGIESGYIWGNQMDLWGTDYAYENIDLNDPDLDPDKRKFALSQKENQMKVQQNFFSHLLIVGIMAGSPRFGEWASSATTRAGYHNSSSLLQMTFGSTGRRITDEDLVNMVRAKYVEGFQNSLRTAPRNEKGEIIDVPKAIREAESAANQQLVRFRDGIEKDLRETVNRVIANPQIAARDILTSTPGVKSIPGVREMQKGISDADYAVIKRKFDEVFERGFAEGELYGLTNRGMHDLLSRYARPDGTLDLKRYLDERGLTEWMDHVTKTYGEGKRDWNSLSKAEREQEVKRIEKIGDDLNTSFGPVNEAIIRLFGSGKSFEGELLQQVLVRRYTDIEQGREATNVIYGRDPMNIWPNLEAFRRFQAQLKTFNEGDYLSLPSGEHVRITAREVAAEPGVGAEGRVRMRFEGNDGVEIKSPDGTAFAHKHRLPGLANEILDLHWYRMRMTYENNWTATVSPEREIWFERTVNGKSESVIIQYEASSRLADVIVRRAGRETKLSTGSDREGLKILLREMGIELSNIPVSQAGGLTSPSRVPLAQTESGRTLHHHLDAKGNPLLDAEGQIYAHSWKAERPNRSELLDVPSIQARFEFKPQEVQSGVELSRDILFQAKVQSGSNKGSVAQVRIRPRGDLHEAEVRIVEGGREFIYNTLNQAREHLGELGIKLRGLSAPSKPLNLQPGEVIHENTVGYWKYDRLISADYSPEYMVQYHRMRYKRFGVETEGWVKVENVGGTMRTTYPDGSQTYTVTIRPEAKEMHTNLNVDERENQRRLVEGLNRDDIGTELDLTTPRSTGEGAANSRSDLRKSKKVDEKNGTTYEFNLPAAAEGEVRFIEPSGEARGRIHLLDRNGIETIIDPNFKNIRFKQGDLDVLYPISIRDFIDIHRMATKEGTAVSEKLFSHVVNDRMSLRHRALTGAPAPEFLPHKATAFDLDVRMNVLRIPTTGEFKTIDLIKQREAITKAYDLRVKEIMEKPASDHRNILLKELNEARTDLVDYLTWLHSKPGRPWAQPAKEPFEGDGWMKSKGRKLWEWYETRRVF